MKRMKMKPTVIMTGMLLAIFGLNACQKTEKPRSPIVVKVGNEALTLDDLKHTIPEELHDKITREELQEYVSRWINAHILYQEGQRASSSGVRS